ncbi:MAG: hypothetical protein H6741_19020 [Alphaproteobacteria bacterium]|nr:hypothetical protein [Alphaproteobacteria bacterium]MCB9794803.1 hypothetical protein [Alphaproteobacteria bacterium]
MSTSLPELRLNYVEHAPDATRSCERCFYFHPNANKKAEGACVDTSNEGSCFGGSVVATGTCKTFVAAAMVDLLSLAAPL